MNAPEVTVLMAVHDGEEFLRQTLDSVASQEYSDFEFVIIDDGSSDATPDLLAAAKQSDSRLRLFRNQTNRGLTRSLNIGLSHARGKYVARIDADDLCKPARLSRQLGFLEAHPDHLAVACGFRLIDDAGRTVRTSDVALDDWQIRWLGGFNPPAPHPTYFFRRLRSDGSPVLYDESFETAQDFDLWSRISEWGKTSVLADVLVDYRRHLGALTSARRKEQAANCRRIGERNLRRRLPSTVVAALEPLLALFAYDASADAATIAAAVAGCDAMLEHDLPLAPSKTHRTWVRRTAAGLLADAILSRAAALESPLQTAAFLYHARSYLPPLAMAVLAQPGLAAKSLRAVGRVGRASAGQAKGH